MTTYRTYTLTIEGPEDEVEDPGVESSMVRHILGGRALRDAEDAINDALPKGWSAKILEWDEDDH